jgi:hypothetical protein
MTYKEDIIVFARNVLNTIAFEAEILSNTDNADGTHTLVLADILYLQEGFKQEIDGNEYKIISVDPATNTIIVQGAEPIEVDTFTPYAVKFFYGNIRETANELKEYLQARDKTPMLYFYEEFKERFYEEPDTNIERESDLRLFFLTQADFKDWQRQDFQDNAIMPMRRLTEHYIEQLKNTARVANLTTWETVNKTRFGVFINEKGVDKAYWADNLSGIELRITIELLKPDNC